MNLRLLLATASLALLSQESLTARTWTSADGSKTFEGKLRAVDENRITVSVLMKGGKLVTFATSLLSEKDNAFLKGEEAQMILARLADEGAAEALQNQKIGKRLTKAGILSKIEGEVFANHQLTRAPEYYIGYFSASW